MNKIPLNFDIKTFITQYNKEGKAFAYHGLDKHTIIFSLSNWNLTYDKGFDNFLNKFILIILTELICCMTLETDGYDSDEKMYYVEPLCDFESFGGICGCKEIANKLLQLNK